MRWDRRPTRCSRSESPKPEARRADNRGDHVRRYRDVRRACLASRLTGVYERSRRPRGVSGRQGQVRRRSRWCADGVRSRRHLAVRVAATLVDRHARSRPRRDLRRSACLVAPALNSHADSEEGGVWEQEEGTRFLVVDLDVWSRRSLLALTEAIGTHVAGPPSQKRYGNRYLASTRSS